MADASVAVDGLEALEIGLKLTTQVALDENLAVIDGLDDGVQLLGGEIFGAGIGVDSGEFQNFFGIAGAHSINVGQGSFDAFFAGDIDSKNAWHSAVAGLVLFV